MNPFDIMIVFEMFESLKNTDIIPSFESFSIHNLIKEHESFIHKYNMQLKNLTFTKNKGHRHLSLCPSVLNPLIFLILLI